MTRAIQQVVRNIPQHWVGDGFPVRSLLSYGGGNRFDPFLLLDYAGPHEFAPVAGKRGVDVHPHKGFETVTILYEGELAHRDSSGGSGRLGPGDVQWMTAGSGIVHEEYHSEPFTRTGGTLEMVQLWVNLPARDKGVPSKYQDLRDADFPRVTLDAGAGEARVIAGEFKGVSGLASTFTPINVWDVQTKGGHPLTFDVPQGHTCVLVVQKGTVRVGDQEATARDLVHFTRDGDQIEMEPRPDARLLVLTGEPLNEPVAGYGPFVMNTDDEIRQAVHDFQSGKWGALD